MIYDIKKNKIIVTDKSQFCIEHICECGQVFSYEKIEKNHYIVFPQDKFAEIIEKENSVEIITQDINYFINYFDLNTDYNEIKKELSKHKMLQLPIKYGYGIRILKQDILETAISFIISANNNIPRIKNSLKKLRSEVGEKMEKFYTFPSLKKLKNLDENFFSSIGTGYRKKSLVKFINQISLCELEKTKFLETKELQSWLISLAGIGPKVADCIMLFAYGKQDVFPVDTWIDKVYNENIAHEDDRKIMRKNLINIFGNLSGFAQQYLFYFKREKN